jgi:hypothetical protein
MQQINKNTQTNCQFSTPYRSFSIKQTKEKGKKRSNFFKSIQIQKETKTKMGMFHIFGA